MDLTYADLANLSSGGHAVAKNVSKNSKCGFVAKLQALKAVTSDDLPQLRPPKAIQVHISAAAAE